MTTPVGTYGVTPDGFVKKPLDTCQSEIDTGLLSILGASAGTEPDGTIPLNSYAGQIKVLLTDMVSAQWDGQEAVYTSFDPTQAGGYSLDSVSAITGTVREPAEYASVTAILAGVPGTTIPQGKLATVQTTGVVFEAEANSTLVTAPAWVAYAVYTFGTVVTRSGNIYVCVIPGSAGLSGPSGTSLGIVDGTVTWDYVGVGTGYAQAAFEATIAGPLGAAAKQLNQITTPVNGWKGVYNLSVAIPGALIEADPNLRIRRAQETAGGGGGTAPAIRAALLEVNQGSTDPLHPPVLSVNVLSNNDDTVDANGLPGHSVECIVNAPATPDADIAQAILDNVGAGIDTVGNTTTILPDDQGKPQTIRWTRPTDVLVWVAGTLYYDPTQWPTGTAPSLVAAYGTSAILTYGTTYPVGQSARSSPLVAAVFDTPAAVDSTGVPLSPAPAGSTVTPGVVDVAPLYIGLTSGPVSSAPITITPRQIARFSTERVALTAIAETP